MIKFEYRADLLEQHPDVCGGVLWATGLQNGLAPAELVERYAAEQAAVRARLPESLSELPTLSAWRQAFRRFGANPTKHRSAAEALLRRLQKKGDIPGINTLVDIGNLVSIRYALPVAIFDVRHVTGRITVCLADGTERFTELDSSEAVHPEPGEVIFVDEAKLVTARRWCWRQSDESASRLDTTTALVTVEAQHSGGREQIEQALADLTALLTQVAGAQVIAGVADAQQPAFSI